MPSKTRKSPAAKVLQEPLTFAADVDNLTFVSGDWTTTTTTGKVTFQVKGNTANSLLSGTVFDDGSFLVDDPGNSAIPALTLTTCKACGNASPKELWCKSDSSQGKKCPECCGVSDAFIKYGKKVSITPIVTKWAESGYASAQWLEKYNAVVLPPPPDLPPPPGNAPAYPNFTCPCGKTYAVIYKAASCCNAAAKDILGSSTYAIEHSLYLYVCAGCGAAYPNGDDVCCDDGYTSTYAVKANAHCLKVALETDDDGPLILPMPIVAVAGKDETATVPWIARGQVVTVRQQPIDHSQWLKVDPVVAMADFYLLSYLEVVDANPSLSDTFGYRHAYELHACEARQLKERLVADIAPIFAAYVDMACGGELRHHSAIKYTPGAAMSPTRHVAWTQWASLRAQVGPEILLDAAKLFGDSTWGRGYGGPLWGAACRLVHKYVTGQYPAWLFVDRVFTMQHNGGSLLNKVAWKGCPGGWIEGMERSSQPYDRVLYPEQRHAGNVDICQTVGNAHASNPPNFNALLFLATTPVKELFRAWWKARNNSLRQEARRMEVAPREWHSPKFESCGGDFAARFSPAGKCDCGEGNDWRFHASACPRASISIPIRVSVYEHCDKKPRPFTDSMTYDEQVKTMDWNSRHARVVRRYYPTYLKNAYIQVVDGREVWREGAKPLTGDEF